MINVHVQKRLCCCTQCPPQILKEGVRSDTKFNITVETSYYFNLELKNSDGKIVCR